MIDRPSALRRRLTWALAALTVGTALLVGLALWASDAYIEDAAVRDLMEQELDFLSGHSSPSAEAAAAHGTLRYFEQRAAPPELQTFSPGFHGDVVLGGREYAVLVRETDAGERVYLAYDESFVEHRERALGLVAGMVLLLVIGSSGSIARRLAGQALRPLDRLVVQLEHLDPERRGERLALSDADSELQVFVDSMNQYMHKLDALVERERAFAAAASHELRTPLAVIQGATETLALAGETPALARVRRAVRQASTELDALLALSRLREAPASEHLQLVEFLHAIADSHIADPAVRATLVWDAPQPVMLTAPPGAVAVIFGNLLRNALRAAGSGSVRIRVREDAVELHDDGPGVPADELPQVFEPGFRGRDGGSGMGLYIARVLAQRFGWQLSLDNHPQGGAVARWRLSA